MLAHVKPRRKSPVPPPFQDHQKFADDIRSRMSDGNSRSSASACLAQYVGPKKLCSAIEEHTTHHAARRAIQKARKRFESMLDWDNDGEKRTVWRVAAAEYNLLRMSRVIAEAETKVPIVAYPSISYVCLSEPLEGYYNGIGFHWQRKSVGMRGLRRQVLLLRRSQTRSSAPC